MIPVVVSPAQQTNNKCCICASEACHCRMIGRMIFDEFQKYRSKIVPYIVIPKTGSESSILQSVVTDSNNFIKSQSGDLENNKGLHICLHTDANDTTSSGITTFFYSGGGLGERLAINIHKRLLKLSGLPDRGCYARPGLFELKNTIASAVMVEMGFHDNPVEAKWIHDNMSKIAHEIVLGTYETLELEPMTQKITWNEILDKVSTETDSWKNAITVAVNAAKADGNLGALEIFEWLPDLIEKVYNTNK